MAWNWSNPTPSEATGAALGSRYEVQAPSIGPLIAAILAARDRKAKEDQAAMQSMISGIGSVAGGIQQGYQRGQMDDAANRAIYQAQYPQDPYMGQPGYDERVPDYGGTMGYQAQLNAAKLRDIQNELAADDLKRKLLEARITSTKATPSSGGGGGTTPYGGDGQTTFWDEQGREWRYGPGGRPIPMFRPPGTGRTSKEPQVHMGQAEKDAIASLAPEYEPQTVYPQEEPQGATPAPAQGGIAPSREAAEIGGYYRAPDGSIRQRKS